MPVLPHTSAPDHDESTAMTEQTPTTIAAFRDEYRFLSNFAPVPGGVDVAFPGTAERLSASTTEHVYQALKTLDPTERVAVLEARSPGSAKKLGLGVTLRPDWEQVKDVVMWACLNAKFQEPSLAQKLLATGDALLVEGNHWHDVYWGRCTCDRHGGEGRNELGNQLMLLRTKLRRVG